MNALEDEKVVILSKKGHTALITLNRPKSLNSLNGALCAGLTEIIDELERDNEIREIINSNYKLY